MGLLLVIVVLLGARSLFPPLGRPSGDGPGPLPDLGAVPDFSLTEPSGSPVSLESLRGRIWVADFIFTRCTGACPLLSGRMLALQKALRGRDDFRLVSFSVDPDFDTPAVLRAYARDHGAESALWLFLTGPRVALQRLVGEGFHLAIAKAPEGTAAPGELITHSDRLVLVDREGRIRGYYHGSEEETVRHLLFDIDALTTGR